MNTTQEPSTNNVNAAQKPLLDTLIGLGSSWAVFGLKIGKMAIAQTAEALGKTAETLDTLAATMQKKADQANGEAPAAPVNTTGTKEAAPEEPSN